MSQSSAILLYLQSGHTLTAYDALRMFNCFRLAARVDQLRKDGHSIETTMVKGDGKTWAEYRLRRPVQQALFADVQADLRVGA
jgi:hypothetical protein